MNQITVFVSGFVLGAVLMAGFFYVSIRWTFYRLKLHICNGHVEHEYELRRKDIIEPTPTR